MLYFIVCTSSLFLTSDKENLATSLNTSLATAMPQSNAVVAKPETTVAPTFAVLTANGLTTSFIATLEVVCKAVPIELTFAWIALALT